MNRDRIEAKSQLFNQRGMNWFIKDLEEEINKFYSDVDRYIEIEHFADVLKKTYIEQLKEKEGKLRQTKFKF